MGEHKPRSQRADVAAHTASDHAHPTSIRVLELFFALFESERGLKRFQIAALPQYRDMGEEFFTVTFARDCEHLSELGIRINETSDHLGQIRYTVDSHTVRSGSEMRLSPQQLILIHMALQACATPADEVLPILDLTLRATVDDPVPPAHEQQARVETSEGMSAIMQAIRTQTPISFSYTSQTESTTRSLEPWKLLVRGHSTYVWGYDLDRQEPRVFRLSRIEGDIEFLGEAGDCDHEPPHGIDAFDDFHVSPVLLIREGALLPFAHELHPIEGQAPSGWTRMQGQDATYAEWEQRLIDRALDCVPIAPSNFRRKLIKLVETAAKGVRNA